MRASIPDDIRAAGWAVAVHNDYCQSGKAMTFWLFTREDWSATGEGESDAAALNQVRRSIGLPVIEER